jgi:hypothetical protein
MMRRPPVDKAAVDDDAVGVEGGRGGDNFG